MSTAEETGAGEDSGAGDQMADGGTTAGAPVSVLTVGQRLKAERERLGMSAAKAADGIHLDAWAIDALESGDYARLGPAVYAKGHLKRYADLLRLPSADILAAFDPRASEAPPQEQPGNSLRMPAADAPKRELPWMQMAAAGVLLLIVAGVVWWKPWHRLAAGGSGTPAVAASGQAKGAAGAGGAADTAASAPSVQTAAAPAANPVPVTPAPAPAMVMSPPSPADSDLSAGVGRARLRLTFSSDSWVDVHDAAGRRVFAGNCHAHSVRTLNGAAPLRVHLGAAGGVQMEVNNRQVPIPAQFIVRNASDFAVGADGVVRALPSGSSPAPAPHPRG